MQRPKQQARARARARKTREVELAKEAMLTPEYWLYGLALFIVVILVVR